MLLLVLIPILLSLGCGPQNARTVIFISIDTLRKDHLGCYGYQRNTSPNLDRFAADDAVLFESAYVQAPYTLTSHLSMLTGLYPEAHGILRALRKGEDGKMLPARLSDRVVTLAEMMKEGGYATSAFTDGGLMSRIYGFDQGFDEYRDERVAKKASNGFRRYGNALHEWIRDRGQEDFFLFIHTFDTHGPYDPPPPFASRFKDGPPARELPEASLMHCSLLGVHDALELESYENLQEVVNAYDGCIAYVDDEIGRLFALLKQLDLWDDAMIVITSDHGEQFMENGLMIGHGLSLTNEMVNVPLLIKFPGSRHAGRRVEHMVESVDLMPTVAAASELTAPEGVQGQNLLAALEDRKWRKKHAYGVSPYTGNNRYLIQNDIKYVQAVDDPDSRMMGVHLQPETPPGADGPSGYDFYHREKGKFYYYDFDQDPLGVSMKFHRGVETFDLRGGACEPNAEMLRNESLIRQFEAGINGMIQDSLRLASRYQADQPATGSLSEEKIQQLNALGYGGLLAADSHSAEEGSGAVSDNRGLSRRELPRDIDRSLLNAGDHILWQDYRQVMLGNPSDLGTEEVRRIRHEEARGYYEKFLNRYPECEHWVSWRIWCLDNYATIIESLKKTEERKPSKK